MLAPLWSVSCRTIGQQSHFCPRFQNTAVINPQLPFTWWNIKTKEEFNKHVKFMAVLSLGSNWANVFFFSGRPDPSQTFFAKKAGFQTEIK